MPVRILIADDHDIIRAGLRSILEGMPDHVVVAEADSGRAALEMARLHRPDLVVMDVSMPGMDGIEATAALRRELPSTRVLALSMHEDREFLVRMIKAGASGYLLKIGAAKEIGTAIRDVLAGRIYLSPSMIDGVVKDLVTRDDAKEERTDPPPLSPRQQEVLDQIVSGKALKEIAFEMGLSVKTLEKHRAQLMGRLGAKSPAELAMVAMRLGLVDPWKPRGGT
ncbi:MAG TPA: response regulator transcription factor [Holophaga sp.]|nr:response regulator transcription factor [Holophaga sp.]